MSVGTAISIIFVIFITIVKEQWEQRKKKRDRRKHHRPFPVPREPSGGRDFEIPQIEGAPSLEEEPVPSFDSMEQEEREQASQIFLETLQRRKEQQGAASKLGMPSGIAETGKDSVGQAASLQLNPQSALQAMALAEVLGKPRAYRNRR